jgi:hypothetical protein
MDINLSLDFVGFPNSHNYDEDESLTFVLSLFPLKLSQGRGFVDGKFSLKYSPMGSCRIPFT